MPVFSRRISGSGRNGKFAGGFSVTLYDLGFNSRTSKSLSMSAKAAAAYESNCMWTMI